MKRTPQELRKIADALEWTALAAGVVFVLVVYGKPAPNSPVFTATMWAFILSAAAAWTMSSPSVLVVIMPWYRTYYEKIGRTVISLSYTSVLRLVLILVLFALIGFLSVPTRTL